MVNLSALRLDLPIILILRAIIPSNFLFGLGLSHRQTRPRSATTEHVGSILDTREKRKPYQNKSFSFARTYMAKRRKLVFLRRLTVVLAIFVFLGTVYLMFSADPGTVDKSRIEAAKHDDDDVASLKDHCAADSANTHRLAVIVPFRDCFDELMEFVPYMQKFLCRQKIRHRIIVVNQLDLFRFNRATLINVGFLIGEKLSCDYIVMHDVDLLPQNDNLSYAYPLNGPFHVAAPALHPKYHYYKFVGGILLITNTHFRQINGLSNRFWGWGREDDEFYLRMTTNNLTIRRPQGIKTGNKTFKHMHDKIKRNRDYSRYGDQRANSKRDRVTGLNSTVYSEVSISNITINGAVATVVGVELECNIRDTPWCLTPKQLKETLADLKKKLPPEEFADIENDLVKHKIIQKTKD